MAVPLLDLFCPHDSSDVTFLFTRFCIAYVYWTTMICNSWQCETPKGKQFLKFDDCPDKQFCGQTCHKRFLDSPHPETTHCGMCHAEKCENDIITNCCNTVLCNVCAMCLDLEKCPFCGSIAYGSLASKVPSARRCFGPGCVAVSKTVMQCKKCHLVK